MKWEDTLIAHHSFAGHLPKSLSHVTSVYCDARPWKLLHGTEAAAEKGLARWEDPEDMLPYNASDVALTFLDWQRMQNDLAPALRVYESDKVMAGLCTRMTMVGIGFDETRKEELAEALRARKRGLLGAMRQLLDRRGFNPRQTEQLRHALFGRFGAEPSKLTPTGLASTNNETLEGMRYRDTRAGKLADYILRWRAVDKTLGTYVEKPIVSAGRSIGRVHPPWKLGPVTGRLACWAMTLPRYNPNDIEAQVKEMYVAAPGHELVYYDLSQAEARIAAYFSGDENLIAAVAEDIHLANALVAFGFDADAVKRISRGNDLSPLLDEKGKPKKWKKVPKKQGGCMEERDVAKNVGFCVWYEGSAEKAYATLRQHGFQAQLAACQEIVRRFRQKYRGYYRYVDANERVVRETGVLHSVLLGRAGYLGQHVLRTEIANRPIQGGIADVHNERLPRIEARLPRRAKVIGQFHDAAVFEAPLGKSADETERIVRDVWSEPITVPHNGLQFVLPIECKRGARLSDF